MAISSEEKNVRQQFCKIVQLIYYSILWQISLQEGIVQTDGNPCISLLLVLLLLRLDLNWSAGAFGGAKFKFDSMSVIPPSNFARFVNSISIKLSWSEVVHNGAAIIVEILTQSFKLEIWKGDSRGGAKKF